MRIPHSAIPRPWLLMPRPAQSPRHPLLLSNPRQRPRLPPKEVRGREGFPERRSGGEGCPEGKSFLKKRIQPPTQGRSKGQSKGKAKASISRCKAKAKASPTPSAGSKAKPQPKKSTKEKGKKGKYSDLRTDPVWKKMHSVPRHMFSLPGFQKLIVFLGVYVDYFI